MKIRTVDQGYFRVTFEQAKKILCSGLKPQQWTKATLQVITKQNDYRRI